MCRSLRLGPLTNAWSDPFSPAFPLASGKESNEAKLADDCLFNRAGGGGSEILLKDIKGCRRCGDGGTVGPWWRSEVDGKATEVGGLAE